MSNPEKFTPKKTYDILAEKWEYDKLKNKIEYTREEKKRFEILQKLERQIEKTGISTEKKLAELKEELTPEEETMIRKAINGDSLNTGIEEVFDERDYSLAGSVGETFSQGKKAALETIKKGGWKGILAKFSGAYKIFEEVSEKQGGILGFFAGIAAAFEFFIHGKKDKKEEQEKKEEEKKEKNKNIIKNIVYREVIDFLVVGEDKTEKIKISNLLNDEYIKDKKFIDLKNKNFDKNFLLRQGYTENIINLMVKTLLKKEKFIDKILSKKHPDWRNYNIEQIINLLHKDIIVLSKLYSINSIEDLEKLNLNLSVTKNNEGKIELKGILKEKYQEIRKKEKGLTINLLYNIKKTNLGQNPLDSDFIEKKLENQDLAPEEKEFLRKLNTFGKNIEVLILKKFNLGEDLSKIKGKINLKDALDFYIMTGAPELTGDINKDYKNFNDLQKTYLISKITSLLYGHKLNDLSGKYFSKIKDIISGDIKEYKLPDEFKEILNKVGKTIIDKLIDEGGEIANFAKGYFSKNPGEAFIVGALVLGGVTLAVLKSRFLVFATAIGAGSAGVSKLIDYFFNNKNNS